MKIQDIELHEYYVLHDGTTSRVLNVTIPTGFKRNMVEVENDKTGEVKFVTAKQVVRPAKKGFFSRLMRRS